MSGTSLDGIDIALIDFEQGQVTTLGHLTIPYPDEVRRRILAVSNTNCHTRDISRLHYELPELYAEAVRQTCARFGVALETVELIGCHGQTVYHEGAGALRNSLQLGEPAILAERLQIDVVSDFRARDIAAGGSGAPLVPFVDQLLFFHSDTPRVALNIGGIANITVLAQGAPVLAFDTGPGNMVMDQLVEVHTGGAQRYDRDGAIAASGTVDRELLAELMKAPYLAAPPPKTAGREDYGTSYVQELLASGRSLPDLIATAAAFTASSIAMGVQQYAPGTRELIAGGGGVHNPVLMGLLALALPRCRVLSTAAFGIDPDAKEAIAFAILAYETVHGRPGNLPSATGASRAVVLGSLTPSTSPSRMAY